MRVRDRKKNQVMRRIYGAATDTNAFSIPGNGAAWSLVAACRLITASSASWVKYAIEMGFGAGNLRLAATQKDKRWTYTAGN